MEQIGAFGQRRVWWEHVFQGTEEEIVMRSLVTSRRWWSFVCDGCGDEGFCIFFLI